MKLKSELPIVLNTLPVPFGDRTSNTSRVKVKAFGRAGPIRPRLGLVKVPAGAPLDLHRPIRRPLRYVF